MRASRAVHLPGNWRARPGVRRLHLYPTSYTSRSLPACGARRLCHGTERARQPMAAGRLCYDCLAAAAAGRAPR